MTHARDAHIAPPPQPTHRTPQTPQYCEEGSLRAALDCGLLVDPEDAPSSGVTGDITGDAAGDAALPLTGLEYVVSLAHDVAVAMMHLHSENMLHGDLKVGCY